MLKKYSKLSTKIVGIIIVIFLAITASFGQYFRRFGYDYAANQNGLEQKIWLVSGFLISLLLISFFCIVVRARLFVPHMRLTLINFIFNRPFLMAVILFMFWGSIVFLIFPGLWNWDFNHQVYELLGNNKGFIHSDMYPIAHYLYTSKATELTNQHGVILTSFYDSIIYLSVQIFGSTFQGIFVLSFGQFLLGTFAIVYALKYFTQTCSNLTKLIVFLVIAVNPYFPVYLSQLTKTPLFAIYFLLFFTIFMQMYEGLSISRKKYCVLFLVTLGMLIAVKFAFMLLIFTVISFSILLKKNWRFFFISTSSAILIFKIVMIVISMSGYVKMDDTIEAKSIQIQQVALYVKRYPNEINASDRKNLSKIFNLSGLQKDYSPRNTDPVKSTATMHPNQSYLYTSVTKSDWNKFNGIWYRMLKKHPKLFIYAFFAKTFGYFDVLDQPRRDVADAGHFAFGVDKPKPYLYKIGNEEQSNLNVLQKILDFYDEMPVLSLFSKPNFWIVLCLILISSKLIFTGNFKFILLFLPFILLTGVLMATPVNNLDRYGSPFLLIIPVVGPWLNNFRIREAEWFYNYFMKTVHIVQPDYLIYRIIGFYFSVFHFWKNV